MHRAQTPSEILPDVVPQITCWVRGGLATPSRTLALGALARTSRVGGPGQDLKGWGPWTGPQGLGALARTSRVGGPGQDLKGWGPWPGPQGLGALARTSRVGDRTMIRWNLSLRHYFLGGSQTILSVSHKPVAPVAQRYHVTSDTLGRESIPANGIFLTEKTKKQE